nr:phage tail tape measure protein [Leminorella grimontii]
MSSVAQSTLSGISNMMTDLVTTGTASFKQFSISILKMIINIINQLMVAFVVQKAMGWINASFNPQGGGEGSASFVGPVQQKWSGGYTGDGGKYEPKGVVHGGEFVFTKEATQAIGVGNLYAMMRGAQGYADGGFVGKAPMYGLNSNAGAGNTPQINVDIYIDNKGNSTSQTSASSNAAAVDKALGDRIKYEVSEGIRRALKNGGQIYNAYQR